MDITPYVDSLRSDLVSVAGAGGPEVAEAAKRLAVALDPALRMVLLEALSHATAEITADLQGASVEVRLKGREPQFVVTPAPPAEPPADDTTLTSPGDTGDEGEDGPVARITLRLPEVLKQRAEDAATRRGQSLNTWLVTAVRLATREGPVNVDLDLSSIPFGPGAPSRARRAHGQQISGWAR